MIAIIGQSSGVNVIFKVKLAEGGLEEVVPLVEVALIHVEDDRGMVEDRDALNLRAEVGAME